MKNPSRLFSRIVITALIITLISTSALPVFAAAPEKDKKAKATAAPQPKPKDPNAVDLDLITRIRLEAFHNSKVMETLSELTDHIGPRLTNSPNMRKANAWTRDQLTKWGMENAHLEAWGPFGRGWSYEVSTTRMTAPDTAELIVLPKAFTPGTDGPVRGNVVRARISSVDDFEKYRGKLKGHIVLLGEPRQLEPHGEVQMKRFDDKELAELSQFKIGERRQYDAAALRRRFQFLPALNKFLNEEQPAVVIEPSRPPGDGGTVFVQGGGSYKKDEPAGPPYLVMNTEHWGRIARLLDRNVAVEMEVNVKAAFYDDDPFGYNTIAEIPGSDSALKDEVVMIGAHLDSWQGGTGATDNGAGSAVMMEVMRILKAVGASPRRTVRIALWSGEEQGLYGSKGYVKEHFGARAPSTDPADKDLPDFMQRSKGAVETKPEHGKISVYFNVDSGTGKIRGVHLQENAAVAPIFQQWMEPFRDLGMTTLTMRNESGSDFLSFDEVGIPGFEFLQDEIEYDSRTHHSNMDVYERIQKEDLMQASAIVASFVYQAAMRDEMLPRKPMPEPAKSEAKPEAAKTPEAAKKDAKK